MNKKLSGAQLVLVPITKMGANKFPFVENIAKRYVKYIDFCPVTKLPETDATGLDITDSMYITIFDQNGNTKLIDGLPLVRLNYQASYGVRQAIASKISLSDCYVLCENEEAVGTVAAFMVYYDLEEFSRRNMTDATVIDNIAVPITTNIRYNKLPDNDRMTGRRFRRLLVDFPEVTPDFHQGLQLHKDSIYITLRKGSYNVVENMPIMLLYQLGMIERTEWANIIFDFQSSYITVGGAGTIPAEDVVGKYVFLNLEFEK